MTVVPAVGTISFARGIPSPDLFPFKELAECARRAVLNDGRAALNYGPPGGYEPMRRWVAGRHETTPDRVLLTPGSLIGLSLTVRHFARPGARAIVEVPTYDRMLTALRDFGVEIAPIARTAAGFDLDRLRTLANETPAPCFFYTIPTFHNPTGTSLGATTREALAEIADECDLLVFEDDPYGLLSIDEKPPPHVYDFLRQRGRSDLALLSLSFSKTVSPGLRVGSLVVPEHLVSPLEALITKTYLSPPLLSQAQLFEFVSGGYLEPHLRRLSEALGARRDAVLGAFEVGMPRGTRWTRPGGGYFIWLDFPDFLDAATVNESAEISGVTFVPGSGFFPHEAGRRSARISFSFPTAGEAEEGARRLAAVTHSASKQ